MAPESVLLRIRLGSGIELVTFHHLASYHHPPARWADGRGHCELPRYGVRPSPSPGRPQPYINIDIRHLSDSRYRLEKKKTQQTHDRYSDPDKLFPTEGSHPTATARFPRESPANSSLTLVFSPLPQFSR
ncbi:hypothetical protein EVAR_48848_1 [Eumeta japonica]|uniref:Uncharacterized protein n=1 Tax=Eumeta variegata TaxID=151549 RepID=A0A4C1YD15_EUMVA|nr:hypothetical protein EVAR_48848_1 [Eumeta japonica]